MLILLPLISFLVIQSSEAGVVKSVSYSLGSDPSDLKSVDGKIYYSTSNVVSRSINGPSTYRVISSSGNKKRIVRQSSTYSAPTSNNVFLSTSSSQPVSTSYISNPVSNSVSTNIASNPVSTSYISSSSPSLPTTYISSSSSSLPTTYISSGSSIPLPSSSISASSSTSSESNPLAGLTSLLSTKSSNGGSTDILGGVGGVLTAATGGIKTALEIKRDIILPLIMGLMELLKNVASSNTLQAIARVQLDAAETALTVGPSLVNSLAELAETAGDVTSSLIKIILCNLICPIQEDVNSCKVQSTCDAETSTSEVIKPSYSSPSSSYIVS